MISQKVIQSNSQLTMLSEWISWILPFSAMGKLQWGPHAQLLVNLAKEGEIVDSCARVQHLYLLSAILVIAIYILVMLTSLGIVPLKVTMNLG